jgi:hypothetical protein
MATRVQELQKELAEKLRQINEEFHRIIAEKGHCYERNQDIQNCDCAYYYGKWVETKQEYSESIARASKELQEE